MVVSIRYAVYARLFAASIANVNPMPLACVTPIASSGLLGHARYADGNRSAQ